MSRLLKPPLTGILGQLRGCDHDFLEELWTQYQPYADDNFASALSTDVHARFWEMYLAVVLLRQGKQLLRRSERAGEGGA